MHTCNTLSVVSLILVFLVAANSVQAADPNSEPLWPKGAPGTAGIADNEKGGDRGKDGKPNRFISGVVNPALTIYMAPDANSLSSAVVICPGGGYGGVAIDKEGHDIARWLNVHGVAGIVLKYRMPKPDLMKDFKTEKPWPLQDVQRAIRVVRGRAAELHVDANRVGVMGFSAGGHLASTAGTHFDLGDANASDPLDRLSCRPDFMILCYPVIMMGEKAAHTGSVKNLLGAKPDESILRMYSNEKQVTPQTPPVFMVHTRDDGVKVENTLKFQEACQKAGVPIEVQLYDKGGHGYGLGVNGGEVAQWPDRLAEWLCKMKFAPAK